MANTSHDRLVREFITSESSSPDGDWWIEVPVAIEEDIQGEILSGSSLKADALCVTSRPDEEPVEYQLKSSGMKFQNSDHLHGDSDYRGLWEEDEFEDETGVLVEVKSDRPTLKGIGQLHCYGALLEDEWGINLQNYYLVSTESAPAVDRACNQLGIVRVVLDI